MNLLTALLLHSQDDVYRDRIINTQEKKKRRGKKFSFGILSNILCSCLTSKKAPVGAILIFAIGAILPLDGGTCLVYVHLHSFADGEDVSSARLMHMLNTGKTTRQQQSLCHESNALKHLWKSLSALQIKDTPFSCCSHPVLEHVHKLV